MYHIQYTDACLTIIITIHTHTHTHTQTHTTYYVHTLISQLSQPQSQTRRPKSTSSEISYNSVSEADAARESSCMRQMSPCASSLPFFAVLESGLRLAVADVEDPLSPTAPLCRKEAGVGFVVPVPAVPPISNSSVMC